MVNDSFTNEARIEHCQRGLANAQETIRFLDGKSGVIIGFAGALLGWIGTKIGGVLVELPLGLTTIKIAVSLTVLSLVLLSGAILLSICSLLARPRKTFGNHLILFPYVRAREFDSAHKVYKGATCKIDSKGILLEYADQLTNLGLICKKKIDWHRRAVICGGVGIFVLLLMLSVVFTGARIARDEQHAQATTITCEHAPHMFSRVGKVKS